MGRAAHRDRGDGVTGRADRCGHTTKSEHRLLALEGHPVCADPGQLRGQLRRRSDREPGPAGHQTRGCARIVGRDHLTERRIEARGDACKLTAVHDLTGAPGTAANVSNDGWTVVLSGLKTLLETGEPLAVAPAA